MARINIEEKLKSDRRFTNLILKLGSYETALGALVHLWTVAQEQWKRDQSLITEAQFKEQEINPTLIEVGFVEKKEDGYYAKGAKEHFAWLLQKVVAGKKGGEKSGASRRSENNNLPRSGAKAARSGSKRASSGVNPPTPTPTLPLSPVPSSSQTQDLFSLNTVPAGSEPPLGQEIDFKVLNRKIWDSYKNAYYQRYQVEPARNATINSQIASFGKRLGEVAPEVISFYLKSNNGFYLQKCHSVGAALADAESLHTQYLRGRAITRNDVKNAEKVDGYVSIAQDIEKGRL